MRILELNNKKHYEITEKEFQLIRNSSAGASGVLIELPRLQLVINSFAITSIEPVQGQIGERVPYLIEGRDSQGRDSSWRGFYVGGHYICKSNDGEERYFEITATDLKVNGYTVNQEDEILEERYKEKVKSLLKENNEKKQLK